MNYFDRVNLSVSGDALHAAFGISAVTFGYLSSAYSWSYAALQLPSGYLLDRFGVKFVGRVSTLLWSVASFAAAISTGLTGFLSARLLLGIGEAPTFPANSKAIGYWFPVGERSLATAFFDSAAKLASAIGVPFLGILMIHFGWRWSFAVTGLISLFYFSFFIGSIGIPAKINCSPLPSANSSSNMARNPRIARRRRRGPLSDIYCASERCGAWCWGLRPTTTLSICC